MIPVSKAAPARSSLSSVRRPGPPREIPGALNFGSCNHSIKFAEEAKTKHGQPSKVSPKRTGRDHLWSGAPRWHSHR